MSPLCKKLFLLTDFHAVPCLPHALSLWLNNPRETELFNSGILHFWFPLPTLPHSRRARREALVFVHVQGRELGLSRKSEYCCNLMAPSVYLSIIHCMLKGQRWAAVLAKARLNPSLIGRLWGLGVRVQKECAHVCTRPCFMILSIPIWSQWH